MTQINLSKTQFYSGFSGFGNSTRQPLSFVVPATTVSNANGQYTFAVPLVNINGLTNQEFQMTGLNPNWYQLGGYFITYYDQNNNLTTSTNAYYQIEVDGGFAGSNFVVTVLVTLGFAAVGAVTAPSFTLNLNLSLFTTPF